MKTQAQKLFNYFGRLFFLFSVCLCVFVVACDQKKPIDNDKKSSYKLIIKSKGTPTFTSRTVAECLKEKACVWYVFSNQIKRPDLDVSKPVLKKWQEPIKVAVLGDEDKRIEKEIEVISSKLRSAYPYEIDISESPNFVIVSSDNFNNDLFIKYKDFFDRFANGQIFNAYNAYVPAADADYAVLPGSDKNNHYKMAVLFIKKDKLDLLQNTFLQSISFAKPFPRVSELQDYKSDTVNDLNLYLVRVLYHPSMTTDKNYSEVGMTFNQIYPFSAHER